MAEMRLMIDLAMYEPDIPGNAGALMRLAACTASVLHIIGPTGFQMSDTALRRAGMDYIELASVYRHLDWKAFEDWRRGENRRLVLLSTAAETSYLDFVFQPGDLLVLGRESSGVPLRVREAADAAIVIPMAPGARSLNVAIAGAMALGEGLRQVGRRAQESHRS
jgi:tRNA (cytidine/uridine-2'-O-)-methyltransferase